MKSIAKGLAVAALAAASAHAAGPAPAGTVGRIGVEYHFESKGEKAGNDSWAQWRIERWASLSAEVTAQKPTAQASMARPDAAQQHRLQQAAATMPSMQPMMASAEKIVERCKGDDACVEREVQKMGLGMSGGDVAQAQAAGRQVMALTAQGPASVQLWRPRSQRGEYRIAEEVKRQWAEMTCGSKPSNRCRRTELRQGAGAIPDAAGGGRPTTAMLEIDHAKNTLTVLLPVWLNALPVEQTVTSDAPNDRDIGTRSVASAWRITDGKPFTVPLVASGEQVREVVDGAGFKGTLTVRWSFSAR